MFAARGTVLAAGVKIPSGVALQGGTVLPFAVTLAAGSVWAAGANLALLTTNGAQTVTLDEPGGSILLTGGELIPRRQHAQIHHQGRRHRAAAAGRERRAGPDLRHRHAAAAG